MFNVHLILNKGNVEMANMYFEIVIDINNKVLLIISIILNNSK